MSGREFWENVHADADLIWLGCQEGDSPSDDCIFVGYRKQARFSVPVRSIRDHTWSEFRDVFTLKRPARIMTQVTRIVGYYALLHNFNESKKQELIDRRRGDYLVAGDGHTFDRARATARSVASPMLYRSSQLELKESVPVRTKPQLACEAVAVA